MQAPSNYATVAAKRTWIEAVAPRQGAGVDRVPDIVYGAAIAYEVPTEKILLRFTSALAEKRKRYVAAVQKRIIQPQDTYVLALNSRGIPHADGGDGVPYFVQAFLPFGPLTVLVDSKTFEITDRFRAY